MPPTLSMADDFPEFQELMKQTALLHFLTRDLDSHHKPLDILHSSTSTCVALPINEALLEPAKTVQQTPATAPPACKHTSKKYHTCWSWIQNFYFHM